jgi:uncharacterized membrane protein
MMMNDNRTPIAVHVRALRAPAFFMALCLIPILAGLFRLVKVASGEVTSQDDLRFLNSALPVVLHIGASIAFILLGAFQFHEGLRNARPRWHRRAGWVATVAGVLSATTGIWMTLAYDIPVRLQGGLLIGARLLVGTGMAAFLVLALASIRRRDLRNHRAWMMRAYALGLGAGTQAVLFLLPAPFVGEITGFPRDVLLTVAWLLNLFIAEFLIRNQRSERPVESPMRAT